MLQDKKIFVVIPAHNEEANIEKVLTTLPECVDLALVVDDVSTDKTRDKVHAYIQRGQGVPCRLIVHERNAGVGAAIVTGYKQALKDRADVTLVMAGDGQMDPGEVERVAGPVVRGEAEYVKGNRLIHADAWKVMPKHRFLGNSFLSLMTKIASGYWKMADSQTGYTAIALTALEKISWDDLYPRYGFPNDLLVKLNVINARVREVPVRPIYEGQSSGIRLAKVVPTLSLLLARGFFWRMKTKYVIQDFHPLVFFYFFGLLFFLFGTLFGVYLVIYRFAAGPVSATSALFSALFFISGLQSLFFAMWFDMEDNRDLFSKER